MLALAALSARRLAAWAALDRVPAIALDVFGDSDTRALSRSWLPVGRASPPAFDAGLLLDTLAALARRGDVAGWVAGGGFEGDLALLDAGARRLPLWGTAAADQRRLADARGFFADLAAHALPHPPVRFDPPDEPGWLRKRAASAGGWGVDRGCLPEPGAYWQRERGGPVMSATFVANGERAVVLGINRQHTVALGERPYVFCGVAGPVAADEGLRRDVDHALHHLVPTYRLRGLGSLDFVAERGRAELLEVNARPPASAALYPWVGGRTPLMAHLRACREGELPGAPPVRGARALRIVYAPCGTTIDGSRALALAARPQVHDRPAAGTRCAPGEPVCSVETEGADLAAAEAAAEAEVAVLKNLLETAA